MIIYQISYQLLDKTVIQDVLVIKYHSNKMFLLCEAEPMLYFVPILNLKLIFCLAEDADRQWRSCPLERN